MEREIDKTYNEKLLYNNIDNSILIDAKKQIKEDIEKYILKDEDNLDELIIKEEIMRETILPTVQNFNILMSLYTHEYEKIVDRILLFKQCLNDCNELTLREKRLKFYSSSS